MNRQRVLEIAVGVGRNNVDIHMDFVCCHESHIWVGPTNSDIGCPVGAQCRVDWHENSYE